MATCRLVITTVSVRRVARRASVESPTALTAAFRARVLINGGTRLGRRAGRGLETAAAGRRRGSCAAAAVADPGGGTRPGVGTPT